MVTIGVYQSLSNSDLYEHIFLKKNQKLYKSYGKCDYQQKYKAIIEASMVCIHEEFTDNNSMKPGTHVTIKKPKEIK